MMIYWPHKLPKALTFFKLSHEWQMLGTRLAIKPSKTALHNGVLMSKKMKMNMTEWMRNSIHFLRN